MFTDVLSYDRVRRWEKNFDSGLELIENTLKSGRQKSASCDIIVLKIKETVERDAGYTVCDIAQMVGISLLRVHYILKNILNTRKISFRWVPRLLTDGQKRQRVKIATLLLKTSPKYDEMKFANVVTGDETWVCYFEPVRKIKM